MWCDGTSTSALCSFQGIVALLLCIIHLPCFLIFLSMKRKRGHITLLLHRVGPIVCVGMLGFFLDCFALHPIQITGEFLFDTSYTIYIWLFPMICYYTLGALYSVAKEKPPELLPLLYLHLIILLSLAWGHHVERLANKTDYLNSAFLLSTFLTFLFSLPLFWISYRRVLFMIKQSQQNVQQLSGPTAQMAYINRFKWSAYLLTIVCVCAMIAFLNWFIDSVKKPNQWVDPDSRRPGEGLFIAFLLQAAGLMLALWTSWLPIKEYFLQAGDSIPTQPPSSLRSDPLPSPSFVTRTVANPRQSQVTELQEVEGQPISQERMNENDV